MALPRSLMEKSVRSAIQRHLRGWAPYPHVQVVDTQEGHRVQWSAVRDILDHSQRVVVDTIGTPSRRNFAIVGVQGARKWDKTDAHMMDNDPHLLVLQPWTFAAVPESLAALSQDECSMALAHVHDSWSKNPQAAPILRMLDAQQFSPAVALHTCLDALAAASTPDALYDPTSCTEPLSRIILGHAMDSGRKTWACKFEHTRVPWNNMVLVAWENSGGWNMAIIPQEDPRLFSNYHWQVTPKCLVFYDRLPSNAPEDTMMGRGSFERYARSYHSNDELLSSHWRQLQALCLSKPAAIEPDAAWTRPVASRFKKGLLTEGSFSLEYYSALRAFEEKAFDYLLARAATPEGLALGACMTIGRSLNEPPKNINDFQERFAEWGCAIEKVGKEEFVVDGLVFEGMGL